MLYIEKKVPMTELSSVVSKPRWTARDSMCLGLAAFVAINVLMCLWVAVTSMSTARRQASAVFFALENASAISFNLTLQTTASATERLNVTGSLRPRLSECSHRLHFDGRMVVTTANESELFVLRNHRGYRRSLSTSNASATCLTTRDIPPLHALKDTVHSAFRPELYSEFDVHCKPLQFTFFDTPFVVCAEDWLRARTMTTALSNPDADDSAENQPTDPVLVIHGKRSALELTVLSDSAESPVEPFGQLEQCEYLQAPMTSGEVCSIQPRRCFGPHIDACKKREDSCGVQRDDKVNKCK